MPKQKSKPGAKKSQKQVGGGATPTDYQEAQRRKQTRDQQAEGPQPDKHGGSGAGRQQGGSGPGREHR